MSAFRLDHGDECRRETAYGWILVAVAVIAIVMIWQDHRAHLLGVIPYLILLSCPLLHLLHRRGGHSHRGHRSGE